MLAHFTNEETEEEVSDTNCLRTLKQQVTKPLTNPGSLTQDSVLSVT